MIDTTAISQYALDLAALGWHVFPCASDKRPVETGGTNPKTGEPYRLAWGSKATNDPEKVTAFWHRCPDALIGVACERSGIFALDIDRKEADGFLALAEMIDSAGDGQALLPVTGPAQSTPSGGAHYIYHLPEDLKIPNTAGKLRPGLDLRSNGYICTGPGYAWLPGHEPSQPLTDAPAWLLDEIRKIGQKTPKTAPRMAPAGNNGRDPAESGSYWLQRALQQAVEGTRNHTGFWLSAQLRDSGMSQSEAETVMLDYAARVPGNGYSEGEALASLRSAYQAPARDPVSSFAHGYVFEGPDTDASLSTSLSQGSGAPEQPETIPALGNLTDDANAVRLARSCFETARFVNEWGWVVYDGKRWLEDKTGEMMRKARRSAREIYQEAARAAAAGTDDRAKDLAKWASRSLYLTRLNAMITIAESILPAQAENFDRDLYMLAVQNGLLDLRTGELQPHDPECYITKIAGANYDPDAKAPTWLAFLDKVFNSDRDVIAFIQRAVGYSLTGDVGEQCLFFLYGIGANGKSTFTGTVQRLLGDYAMKTRAETLMTRRHDTIPEEVAQLAGVRFMLAAELGEGQRLNEGLIKDLTGGDAIRGRFLYRKSFEFYPVAKPWLYGNHKPTVRGSDEGIWRRVKLIPFEVVIPESQRDPKMPEKLAAELDGILAWAVEGCLEWQRSGLRTPESIKAATKDYRQEQDILADFKADCCYFGPNAESVAGELYEAYSHYAGKQAMSQRAFSQRILELEGVSKGGRNSAGRQIYKGIGLLEDSKPDKVQAEQIPFDPNYDPDDQEHPEEITEA